MDFSYPKSWRRGGLHFHLHRELQVNFGWNRIGNSLDFLRSCVITYVGGDPTENCNFTIGKVVLLCRKNIMLCHHAIISSLLRLRAITNAGGDPTENGSFTVGKTALLCRKKCHHVIKSSCHYVIISGYHHVIITLF